MAGTVVFDLDGTLADTSADLIAAANACFAARGMGALLDPVGDALVAFHGGRAMLRAGYGRIPADMILPPGAEDEDFPRLLDHYGSNIARHTRLYPGVEAALDRLAQAGHRLVVCTNKPEALAQTLLRELGIRDCFAALVGADYRKVLVELAAQLGARADDVDALLAIVACHASARIEQALSAEEAQALLRRLDGVEAGARCPHGRAVVAELGLAELEKRAGRG